MVGMDGYLRNLTDADLMDFSLPSWLEIWDLLRSAELIQLTHVDSWVEKHWEALNILNPLVQPYTRGKHAKKKWKCHTVSQWFHPPSPTASLQGRTTQFQNGEELAFLDAWLMAIHGMTQKLHKEPWPLHWSHHRCILRTSLAMTRFHSRQSKQVERWE